MAEDARVEARIGTLAGAGWVPAGPDGDDGTSDPQAGDAAGRTGAVAPDAAGLRERAVRVALDSYVAAHGHPLDHPTTGSGVRWAPSRRLVLTVAVVLGVVVAALAGRSLVALPSTQVPASDPAGGAEALAARPTGAAGGLPDGAGDLRGTEDGVPAGDDVDVVVHVVGAVAEPGLVRLDAGARVADALDAAGGPTAEADLTAVNLARAVVDGEQIHVPVPGEALAPATGGDGAGGVGGGTGLVDVNRADAATLETLPGVGPVLAQRIVAWREEYGPFRHVDDLGEVSGIGPKVLEGLRDHVRVG